MAFQLWWQIEFVDYQTAKFCKNDHSANQTAQEAHDHSYEANTALGIKASQLEQKEGNSNYQKDYQSKGKDDVEYCRNNYE